MLGVDLHSEHIIAEVAIDHPHGKLYDYLCPKSFNLNIGCLVRVPFGRRKIVGLVVKIKKQSNLDFLSLKLIDEVCLTWAPLSSEWIALVSFAANYYQKSVGEVAIPAIPKILRSSNAWKKKEKFIIDKNFSGKEVFFQLSKPSSFYLREEQKFAVDNIKKIEGFSSSLLFGVTCSGKTEVYLHLTQEILNRSRTAQILILVPEINLIPDLMKQFLDRFKFSSRDAIVSMHSGMSDLVRARNWLAVHEGRCKILIGTRLAAMASFCDLRLIVVDEEHEVSYRQQEGLLRYSARDLCVWRAKQLNIPVVLGSASPSLETWYHAKKGHYYRFNLLNRGAFNSFPEIIVVDENERKSSSQSFLTKRSISLVLLEEIKQCLGGGRQSLLFLNRRGFAPILACEACDWVATCSYCSAYLVYHRTDLSLRCHHCGDKIRTPDFCPTCQNVDLSLIGYGTQRIEDELNISLPNVKILRVDADSTRKIGAAEKFFKSIHDQEVQIVIGTNMISKGHDFKNIGLVGVINVDASLFSHDFRSSERVFSQLIQVSGRAGRSQYGSKVLIQTRYPSHPFFSLFVSQDYQGFAEHLLHERREASLPPFINQAILRAEAKSLEKAINFLSVAAQYFDEIKKLLNADVRRYHPVPLAMVKVANRHRAQLLIESSSRRTLHRCLRKWRNQLENSKIYLPAIQNWMIEVDPLDI